MKESSDWYIGTTHFLTAGFAIPVVVNIIAGLLIGLIALNITGNIMIMFVISTVAWLLGLWLGIIYSGKYVAKAYTGYNKRKVIMQGVYYHLFFVAVTLLIFVLAMSNPQAEVAMISIVLSLVSTMISAYLYYVLSMKYLAEKPRTAAQK